MLKELILNALLIFIVLFLLAKTNGESIKDFLSKFDIPSFAPLLKIIGLDEKTIEFISSDSFSHAFSDSSNSKGNDIKFLTELLSKLVFNKKDDKSEKNAARSDSDESEHAEQNSYYAPIKEILPDGISEALSDYFTRQNSDLNAQNNEFIDL